MIFAPLRECSKKKERVRGLITRPLQKYNHRRLQLR
jgi:hypothetical protein